MRRRFGKVFGDRGDIAPPPAEPLWVRDGRRLMTNVRRTMRERLRADTDKLLLSKRALIERVNDQLKHSC